MSVQDSAETPESPESPGTPESPHFADEEDRRHVRERLIFFSDAVIAIAMTLLALELPVPHGETNAEVWRSFVELLPEEYLNFVISFVVIAAFWVAHHQYFRKIHVVDATLRRFNLGWLFLIVVVPFATRVNSEDGHFVLGPVLYAVVISGIALLMVLMAWHAVRARLLRAEAGTHPMRRLVVGAGAVATVFVLSIPVSFAGPSWGKYFWLLTIVVSPITSHLFERFRSRPAR
ncbi:TMEM175 family protein [Microbispora bryophytorum]|uniref:TMEM175 family protein n=1 Tax=Microbispora bryophytorum TaxID=1460882 RepID=UPI003407F248